MRVANTRVQTSFSPSSAPALEQVMTDPGPMVPAASMDQYRRDVVSETARLARELFAGILSRLHGISRNSVAVQKKNRMEKDELHSTTNTPQLILCTG